jgi:hypothetical protein
MLSSMSPITLSHGDGAPGAGAEDCITSTSRLRRAELGNPLRRRPTRRRASPAQLFCVDSGLFVVSARTNKRHHHHRVVCWVDILLVVICGVESAMREGCPRTMTGVSQCWFSGHFRQVFFKHHCIFDRCFSNTIAFTHINIAPTCGAN